MKAVRAICGKLSLGKVKDQRLKAVTHDSCHQNACLYNEDVLSKGILGSTLVFTLVVSLEAPVQLSLYSLEKMYTPKQINKNKQSFKKTFFSIPL